jgi:hypothetical protein
VFLRSSILCGACTGCKQLAPHKMVFPCAFCSQNAYFDDDNTVMPCVHGGPALNVECMPARLAVGQGVKSHRTQVGIEQRSPKFEAETSRTGG